MRTVDLWSFFSQVKGVSKNVLQNRELSVIFFRSDSNKKLPAPYDDIIILKMGQKHKKFCENMGYW